MGNKLILLFMGVMLAACNADNDFVSKEWDSKKDTSLLAVIDIATLHEVQTYLKAEYYKTYSDSVGGSVILLRMKDLAFTSKVQNHYGLDTLDYQQPLIGALDRLTALDISVFDNSGYSLAFLEELDFLTKSTDLSNWVEAIDKKETLNWGEKKLLTDAYAFSSNSGFVMAMGNGNGGGLIDDDWKKGTIVSYVYYKDKSDLTLVVATATRGIINKK